MTPVIPAQLLSALPTPLPTLLGDADPTDVFVGAFFLILLLVLGYLALMQAKKWMAKDDEPDGAIGFTLGDLRRLHSEGRLTDEEFEKARTQMIAATQRAAERAAQAAKEAAQKTGGATVTDIDQLRARAKRAEPPKPASPDSEPDDEAEWQDVPPEEPR